VTLDLLPGRVSGSELVDAKVARVHRDLCAGPESECHRDDERRSRAICGSRSSRLEAGDDFLVRVKSRIGPRLRWGPDSSCCVLYSLSGPARATAPTQGPGYRQPPIADAPASLYVICVVTRQFPLLASVVPTIP
jgi:hypothetical protein